MAVPKQPDQLDAIRFQQMTLNYVELLYKCRLCQMSPVVLPSAETFQQHMHAVHFFGATGAAFCRICELKFHCEADLQAHMAVTHSTGAPEVKRLKTEHPDQPQDLSVRETSMKLEKPHPDPAWQRGNFHPGSGMHDGSRSTPSPYHVKTEPHSENLDGQPGLSSPKPNLPPSGVIDWFSYRTPGAPESQQPKNTCSNVKLEELQRRYGYYASKLVIFDNEFYFCKACHLKFDYDSECEAHFQSEKHRQRVEQQEARNKQHQDFLKHNTQQIQSASPVPRPGSVHQPIPSSNSPFSSAPSPIPSHPSPFMPSMEDRGSPPSEQTTCKSKRKRSLPCRRELSPTLGDADSSDDGGDADTETGDEIPQHPHYTLMQSDRKRLATSDSNVASTDTPSPAGSALTPQQQLQVPAASQSSAVNPATAASRSSAFPGLDYADYPESESDPDSPHSDESDPGKGDNMSNGDIQAKVAILKTYLSKYVMTSPGGAVSRAILLSCMSSEVDTKDSPLWGPACNKAMREVFPDSQAQRKGKFKKTFFFGVELMPEFRSAESSEEVANMMTKDAVQSDFQHEDTRRVLQHLPAVVQWTGAAESSIPRAVLLRALAVHAGDTSLLQMGSECNRAVRQLYPRATIQRTGKFKHTCYFGLEFVPSNNPAANNMKLPFPPRTVSTGPPVVNVLHLMEQQTRGPMSRLPHAAGPRVGHPPTGNIMPGPPVPGLHYPAPNAVVGGPYMYMHPSSVMHSTSSPGTHSSRANSPRHSNSSHSPGLQASRENSPASLTPSGGSPASSGGHGGEPPSKHRKTLHELSNQHKRPVISPLSRGQSPHGDPSVMATNSPQAHGHPANSNHLPSPHQLHASGNGTPPLSMAQGSAPPGVSSQDCRPTVVTSSCAYANSPSSDRQHSTDENQAPGVAASQPDKNSCDPFQQNNTHDIEKLILLNPGAFVTIPQFMVRFQRLAPDRVFRAMKMLEQRGLGTLQKCHTHQGPAYVLYKPLPVPELQVVLELFGITLREYEAMFRERDPRLEVMDQRPLLEMHPQASIVHGHYGH